MKAPINHLGRALLLLLVAAAVIAMPMVQVGLGAKSSIAATGSQADPTLRTNDVSLDIGASMNTSVTLSAAPNGLSGFKINVSVADTSVVEITGADFPAVYELADSSVSADGSTVSLKATDLNDDIGPNATEIRFASIELTGQADGETPLSITITRIDDNDGNRIRPSVSEGSAIVGAGETSDAEDTDTPTTSPTSSTPSATESATPTQRSPESTATAQSPQTASPSPSPSPTTATPTRSQQPSQTSATTGTSAQSTQETTRTTGTEAGTLIPTPSEAGSVTEATETSGQPGFGLFLSILGIALFLVLLTRRR